MKTYRYKLNLVIESDTDQEEWFKENVDNLIENPEDDFLSLKSYELKKEMFFDNGIIVNLKADISC